MATNKNKLRQLLPLLEYLSKCSKLQIRNFVKNAEPHIIRLLSDLCLNFNKGHLTRDEKYIKRLRPYKKLIKSLCYRCHSLKKRRQILQTGGLAGTLISTLVPLLISLLAK